MNINVKFAIWCSKKCLNLWKPPHEVIMWLNDPMDTKKAELAGLASWVAGPILTTSEARAVRAVTSDATWTIENPTKANSVVPWIAERVAESLGSTTDEIRHEFVANMNNEELKTTDPDWIDYINAEIFSRR